jgi:hypothetical protein
MRLAINCHGGPGIVDIDCGCTNSSLVADPGSTQKPLMSVSNLSSYQSQFGALNTLLAPSGALWFMCCLTGQLPAGTNFLIAVSKLLPGRYIGAIATIGYSSGGAMMRPGTGLGEPGMRDTVGVWAAGSQSIEDARYATIWSDLTQLPWAGPSSPHAKIARDGRIIGGGGMNM